MKLFYIKICFLLVLLSSQSYPMDIFQASSIGGLAYIKVILASNPEFKDKQDHHGFTALHYAVCSGNLAVIQELIHAKANPNIQTYAGNSPLHKAACHSSARIVHVLIQAGANVTLENNEGYTPLHYAVDTSCDNTAIIKTLINAEANVDAQTKKGETPLHWAIGYNNIDTIKLLVLAGADLFAQGATTYTPLHYALAQQNKKIIAILRRAQQAHYTARQQMTTLMYAIHPRLGTNSPLSLITDTQRNGLANLIGIAVKHAAIEDALDKTQTHKTCCLVQ